ncbi:MAG: Gfo/Idh/MocA family oxidoreductase [Verrucomicrobiales bacterium]|nr:Gfo/Idh/MocA family oxidoreductase [Verrucomicrobiales bacterium]
MTTRRSLLKGGAATAALFAGPSILRGQNLNSKLQLASIGSDGKGFSDIKAMSSHNYQTYVAFCDIDLNRTLNVKKLSPETPIYQDFREMLAEKGEEIDAVTVSTPDHMHAYCSISAMKLGKHVYCQKPMTHNVWENRQMMKVARESGVITRLGNQIHSHQFYRTAVELVQSGRIGKVKEVQSWVPTPGHGRSGHISRPKGEDPVPDSLDWEKWIGVAPMRPYSAEHRCYHPWGWRDWQDFGSGAIGDFGCHILDPVFTALKITGPTDDYFAHHSGMNDEVWPAQTTYSFTVPGTEYTSGERLEITWNDGGRLPSTKGSHLSAREALPRSGSMLIGEEGTLVIPHVAAPRLYKADGELDEDYEMAEGLDHYHGWIDGCILDEQPSDGFEYGGMLTEPILLANIAIRFPREKLKWDAEEMQFSNHEDANRWLKRDYREGWDLQKLIES